MFSWTSPPEVTFPDDWKLDDFTSSLITDALKSRFTVLRVPAEPDFAKHLNAGLFTTAFSKYRDLLKEKPLSQPVDAYVMIVAREISSGYGDWTGLQLAHMGGALLGREQTLASAAPATLQRIGYAVGTAFDGVLANFSGLAQGAGGSAARTAGFWVFAGFTPMLLIGALCGWRFTRG